MLKVKSGVLPKILWIAAALANIAEDLKTEIVITEGWANHTGHMTTSKHYTYEACDIRTSNLTPEQVTAVLTGLKTRLGTGYDIIRETDHIHCEYDPK